MVVRPARKSGPLASLATASPDGRHRPGCVLSREVCSSGSSQRPVPALDSGACTQWVWSVLKALSPHQGCGTAHDRTLLSGRFPRAVPCERWRAGLREPLEGTSGGDPQETQAFAAYTAHCIS